MPGQIFISSSALPSVLAIDFDSCDSKFPLGVNRREHKFLVIDYKGSSKMGRVSFISPLGEFESLLGIVFSPVVSPLAIRFVPHYIKFIASALAISFTES